MPERFETRPEWLESIRAHVARAPELTPEQLDRLAVLLKPAPANPEPRAQPPKDAA